MVFHDKRFLSTTSVLGFFAIYTIIVLITRNLCANYTVYHRTYILYIYIDASHTTYTYSILNGIVSFEKYIYTDRSEKILT